MPEIQRRSFLAGLAVSPALRAASSGPPRRAQNLYGRLNLIEIVVDTWGAHYLGAYGYGNIETPAADGLAAGSTMFLDCYPEILPTVPVRRVLCTGRRAFPGLLVDNPDDPRFRGWHSLFVEDITLSEQLRAAEELTPFAITTRYPGEDTEVSREEALRAIEIAEFTRLAVIHELRRGGTAIEDD